jgi:hypothetical protein
MSDHEAALAAIRIILSILVARVALGAPNATEALDSMRLQCKLAAEHTTTLGPDRTRVVEAAQTYIDELFRGITIS